MHYVSSQFSISPNSYLESDYNLTSNWGSAPRAASFLVKDTSSLNPITNILRAVEIEF